MDLPLSELSPYLIALGALIACSAFFSGTEVAMFALRRVDKEQLTRENTGSSRLILGLLSKPDRLIATLLLGNEVVNVSVSAVMAGLCGAVFAGYGEIELALVTTFLALPLLLFLGEITPKTVAIKASTGWARKAARPLWFFGVVVTPIRWVVRHIAHLLMLPFGGGTGPVADLGEEEFKALVDAGSAEGEVDAHERQMIHRVFAFGDKTVADVMLPRDQVFALSDQLSYPQLVVEISKRGFSRVPIYSRNLDQVRGLIYAKDLVIHAAYSATGAYLLQDMLHKPLFVPQTTPLKKLFTIFKQRHTHMALVVNEYGKLTGLCTMEDLLEELFGEIHDEREERKQSVQLRRSRMLSEPGALAVVDPERASGSGVAAGDGSAEP